mgnify:CR=1 FL=1
MRTTRRLWYFGVSASRGSTETPRPDATMLRTVSSELVRVTRASAGSARDRRRAPGARKQWPMSSRISVLRAASSSGRIGLAPRPLVVRAARPPGTAPRTGIRVTTPGGANGSAMMATSMRPDRSADSRCSVRFSSRSSGICGAHLVQRRDQIRQEVRGHREDDAESQHAGELVSPRPARSPRSAPLPPAPSAPARRRAPPTGVTVISLCPARTAGAPSSSSSFGSPPTTPAGSRNSAARHGRSFARWRRPRYSEARSASSQMT